MLPQRLRFGAFIAPFHPIEENPTLAIQRDLELVEWMEQLGFDEGWIGEHHSAAYQLIASPEVVLAALSPPADAGRPDQPAGSHDPRTGDVRSRPRRAGVRRLHDGHPGGQAAR